MMSDTYVLFVISLLGLCAASIATFIVAFRKRSPLLVVFVPLIALCGSFIYFSYTSVIGYPTRMEWDQLPNKITVIYFRIVEKSTITLWIMEKGTTRLVELPYSEGAENALEGSRKDMGQGVPVTFVKSGSGNGGKGKRKGKGKFGDGDGDDEGDENGDGRGGRGWRYRVESKGDPIRGSLPPK